MKELTITPPEGYEVDKEKSTFEKIVFKPIDTKPRSWEEFCKNTPLANRCYIHNDGYIQVITPLNTSSMDEVRDVGVLPSEEYAEAFLALMQLISLRQAWIGDWKPNWAIYTEKFVIQCEKNELVTDRWQTVSHPLSFPTQEMALEFLGCFKDLIEQAKLLI